MSCPLGFGELNIPSSRAFWDDCDEDELQEGNPEVKKLEMLCEEGEILELPNVDTFLLVEGTNIVQFSEATLLEGTRKICMIPSLKSSLHYNREKELLMAILQEELTNSGEVTELLLPYAKQANKVITLTVKSRTDYKSDQLSAVSDQITFIRGINAQPHVPTLEAPNFISGVAAGIASWRCNENLQISSYVAYTDNEALDTLAAQPIIELFKRLNINCAATYKPPFKEESNIYM